MRSFFALQNALRVRGTALVANLLGAEQSWRLQSDDHYLHSVPGEKPFKLQRYFMTIPSLSGRGASRKKSGTTLRLKLSQTG